MLGLRIAVCISTCCLCICVCTLILLVTLVKNGGWRIKAGGTGHQNRAGRTRADFKLFQHFQPRLTQIEPRLAGWSSRLFAPTFTRSLATSGHKDHASLPHRTNKLAAPSYYTSLPRRTGRMFSETSKASLQEISKNKLEGCLQRIHRRSWQGHVIA